MKFSTTLALASSLSLAQAFAPQQLQQTSSTTALANDLFGSDGGDNKKEMSQALPFVPRPKLLDGELAGDVGFE